MGETGENTQTETCSSISTQREQEKKKKDARTH